MVNRTLVTTGLLETWPKGKPVYFLGDWCLSYAKQALLKDIDYEIAPYHWNDRLKLKRDFKVLDNYYEKALVVLAEVLNVKHGTSHSLRYWRIVVGPWLGYFTHALYDRWSMLQVAVATGYIDSVTVVDRGPSELIPEDMSEFLGFLETDDWNEMIYADLISLSYLDILSVDRIKLPHSGVDEPGILDRYKGKIGVFSSLILSFFIRFVVSERDFFLKSTTFSVKTLMAIQFRLGNFPKLWRTPTLKSLRKYEFVRSRIKVSSESNFEAILHAMVQRHIPATYDEGYHNLIKNVERLPWPSLPKAIFTHIAWEVDDIFKTWTAAKTELGCPFIIGQHGGHYGIGLFLFIANHEIAISDKYLTWGWSDASVSNVTKSVSFKSWPAGLKHDPFGNVIVLLGLSSRYSGFLWSAPISSQWSSYFDDQVSFLRHLSPEIRAKTCVRVNPKDFGWCSVERINNSVPEVKIDVGLKKITKVIPNCRLVISTYNATTYLESMSRNIPTIIFWDPEFWELKAQAIPYFDLLSSAGIFHKTPQSAARKVCEIWDDVDKWWWSMSVQDARERFCREFVVLSKNLEADVVSDVTDLVICR